MKKIDYNQKLYYLSYLRVKKRGDDSVVIYNYKNNEFLVYSGIDSKLFMLFLKKGDLYSFITAIKKQGVKYEDNILKRAFNILEELTQKGWVKLCDNKSEKLNRECSYLDKIEYFVDNNKFSLDEVFIELTRKCNLNCHHCYIDKNNFEKELSTEKIISFIEDIKQMGVLKVKITGGEPMLHKDFFKIIEYIISKHIGVRIYTNGSYLNTDTIEYLSDIGINEIQISVDGFKESTHDSFRRKKGNLQIIKKALLELENKRINTILSYTVTDFNIREIPLLYNYIKNFKFVKLNASPYINYHRYTFKKENIDKMLNVSKETIIALKKYAYEMQDVWSSKMSYGFSYPNKFIGYCGAGTFSCYLSSKGQVYFCPMLQEEEFKLGDINEMNIKEIWLNSDFLKEYRRYTIRDIEKCSECIAVNFCRGGCRARAYLRNNDLLSNDFISCEMFLNGS